jgi:putative DNA primase/helicase
MEAIDGITDPWTAGSWILEQLKGGFYHQGRFFMLVDDCYEEVELESLQLLCMQLLKEKSSQVKTNHILDRLRFELPQPKDHDYYLAFKDGYCGKDAEFHRDPKYIIEHKVYQYMPFEYDTLGISPIWFEFLDQVFEGDEDRAEKIMLLQEFFGYCFMRDMNLHKSLVLYGDGGNGKSVILDILAAMVPEVTRLEWHELGNSRGLEQLAGSWVNISTEIAYKETNGTTGFKKAIEQGVLTADPKYKKPFTFKPYAKFAFATNGLPLTDDPSNGVFRRLMVLSLNNSFVGREDWELTKKLMEELPGIFNWAMMGAVRLRKQKAFTYVPSNMQELAEYRRAINSLQSFYDEELELLKDEELSFNQFYQNYTGYCIETSNKPFARNKIRGLINQLGLKLKVYTGAANHRYVKALEPININNDNLFS